jgi:hypothetical protein
MAMQRTLLELTQDILVSLDGDEVTSINDTAESRQVAAIVRQCFYEIASNEKLPEHHSLFELVETSSVTPTVMSRPTNIITVSWVKYDNMLNSESSVNYADCTYIPFEDFLAMQKGLDASSTTVDQFSYTMNGEIFPLKVSNDRFPTFYTTPNDLSVVFDSYYLDQEAFLRKTKTMCFGLKESSWTHADTFVAPLDHKLSNLLFQSAKAQCFAELKQIENAKTERSVRRARLTLQKEKEDINGQNRGYYYSNNLPHYGRK